MVRGTNGRQLAVLLKHAYRYRIRGFIDDNVKLHGTYLWGIKYFRQMIFQGLFKNIMLKLFYLQFLVHHVVSVRRLLIA